MAPKRTKGKKWLIVPAALFTMAISGIVIGMLGKMGLSINGEILWNKLAIPVARLICYLTIGLSIGLFVESMGWSAKLAAIARPVTRFGRMKKESATAFVMAFVSGIVANTTLMGYLQEGKLTKRELILSYIMNNGLPIFLVHLPSTFFIVVSIAGDAGLNYLLITFLAACLRTVAAASYSRFTTSPTAYVRQESHLFETTSEISSRTPLLKKLMDRLFRIILYTIPIYVIVFLINQWGVFKILRKAAAGALSADFFPVQEASMVIFTLAAEFSSGFAAAAALMDGGALTVKQASIALVLGTIAAAPVRAIRHQLPTHTGIFSLGLGVELLVLSQVLRILSLLLVLALYALLA
jgi:hypothetical protein